MLRASTIAAQAMVHTLSRSAHRLAILWSCATGVLFAVLTLEVAGASAVTFVAPSTFAGMPTAVRRDLEGRGCQVPQAFGEPQPHNVIEGHFLSATSRDIAVLCSVGGVSSILVYAQGRAETPLALARAADSDYLQTIDGDGTWGFSRRLEALRAPHFARLLDRPPAATGQDPHPARIEHDAIGDAFLLKGRTAHYWTGSRWLAISIAD